MKIGYKFISAPRKSKKPAKPKLKFPKLVEKVVSVSDIILEVLDARFIEQTRNLELEKLIKDQGKKIIYVLNKSDFVDSKKIKKKIIETLELTPFVLVSCKTRRGGKELRDKIKAEVKKLESEHHPAQIGIIGYPNTGKSSLINFLVGKSSARTSAAAGFTKGMQRIRLTSDIRILDTPGVIPEKEYSTSRKDLMAKNAIVGARSYDKIKDPEMAIALLIKSYQNSLEKFCKVKSNGNPETLIEKYGLKKNILQKGGKVDVDRTARLILKNWQQGKMEI